MHVLEYVLEEISLYAFNYYYYGYLHKFAKDSWIDFE